jgi:hypothetical protein
MGCNNVAALCRSELLMTLYIGKAGEFFVAGHLLRLGLNAMPLTVDSGVDLLGHLVTEYGDSRVYQFQVKTTARPIAQFNFEREKFRRLYTQNINLVVVFWSEPSNPLALVLPPRLLRMMTSGGYEAPHAPIRMQRDLISMRVERRDSRVYVRNRYHEFTRMVNRFDLVEASDIDTIHLPEYCCWGEAPSLIEFDGGDPPPRNPNTLGDEQPVGA